jgi:hypothetical protein
MWAGRRGAMPSRGASAWQRWRFFYVQACLRKTSADKLREPLQLSIPHARNFVLCLSISSMSLGEKKCRYCQHTYSGEGREHVFPKGMGGPDIYMDNVCGDCNQKFSSYERALMRDSPVAFMRSVEGIEGYGHTDKGAFLAPILLTFDESKNVVYEVGQRHPFTNFIRPQILLVQEAFYIEGDTRDNTENFNRKFIHWRNKVRYIVIKDVDKLQWVELVDNGVTYKAVVKQVIEKSKEAVKIDLLHDTDIYFVHLSPRLYLSDLGELRVRARSNEEAIEFLIKLMNHTRKAVPLSSLKKDTFTNPVIYVGQKFNGIQFSQGLVKIGINCLMYYYPTFRDDDAFNECISFVMTGKGAVEIKGEEKSPIKDSVEGTHNIFFQQMTFGMNIRISFFNGAGGALSFNVVGLMMMNPGDFNRLVIDYNSHTAEFQNRTQFLTSFDKNHNSTKLC